MKPILKSKRKFRGLFNRYHKKMPLTEIIGKDFNFLVLSIVNFFKNDFKRKSLLVHPHYPSRRSIIYKAAKKLNYNITNKIKSNTEYAIYWEYATTRDEYQSLDEISKKIKVINLNSRDIGKKNIDRVHQEIFGYATLVDPLTHKGKMVRKSDINAMHNGIILDGPIQSFDDRFIYQILIDNSHSNNLVLDIRVPITDHVLDFVYLKQRPVSERFKSSAVNTQIAATIDVFTQEEISLLNKYCKKLNLEFGELDVLRNKDDGRIYTVDVNNTPHGPAEIIHQSDAKFAIKKISDALESFIKSTFVTTNANNPDDL